MGIHMQFDLIFSITSDLDIAGPFYEDNGCLKLSQWFYGGETIGVAEKAVAIYTNPCFLGVHNFSMGDMNLVIDENTGFQHPDDFGYSTDPTYNHAYSNRIFATMCIGTEIFADDDTDRVVNLNSLSNDDPIGIFKVSSAGCWPLF